MNKELLNEIIIRGNRRMTEHDLNLLDSTSREIQAKTIVEIGSMDGCSSMVFGNFVKETGGMLYSIEPRPKTKWMQNISELGLLENIKLIKAASPWLPWCELPFPIDYLLIDGDHRCSRAITDFVALGKMVRKGGRIAFHDIDGGKGIAEYIRQAIDICLRDDNLGSEQGSDYLVKQVARTPLGRDRGTVVLEKLAEAKPYDVI